MLPRRNKSRTWFHFRTKHRPRFHPVRIKIGFIPLKRWSESWLMYVRITSIFLAGWAGKVGGRKEGRTRNWDRRIYFVPDLSSTTRSNKYLGISFQLSPSVSSLAGLLHCLHCKEMRGTRNCKKYVASNIAPNIAAGRI